MNVLLLSYDITDLASDKYALVDNVVLNLQLKKSDAQGIKIIPATNKKTEIVKPIKLLHTVWYLITDRFATEICDEFLDAVKSEVKVKRSEINVVIHELNIGNWDIHPLEKFNLLRKLIEKS